MSNLRDYNTCPKCGVGEMKDMGRVDMCSECKHIIRIPTTTELWLNNLEVGDTIYIKGRSFTKIQLNTGQKYWKDDERGPFYSTINLLNTYGTVAEVRCAS